MADQKDHSDEGSGQGRGGEDGGRHPLSDDGPFTSVNSPSITLGADGGRRGASSSPDTMTLISARVERATAR
jgi:hypothetical protein